jgi:hypothetical protein
MLVVRVAEIVAFGLLGVAVWVVLEMMLRSWRERRDDRRRRRARR